MEKFIIKDHQGFFLTIDSNGVLQSEKNISSLPVYCMDSGQDGIIIFFNENNKFKILGLEGRRFSFVFQKDKSGEFFFAKSRENNFYLSSPFRGGKLECNRLGAEEWEKFHLESVGQVTESDLQLFFLIRKAYEGDIDYLIFKFISEYFFSKYISDFLYTLESRYLEYFADLLEKNSLLRNKLFENYSGEEFLLMKSLEKSKDQEKRILDCGPEFDYLGQIDNIGDFLEYYNAPFNRVASIIRSHTVPKKNHCVVACCKNEGAYLVEWIAYHRLLGVDDFFIYSNDNTDGSDVLLEELAREGFIYYLKNNIEVETSPQLKAYAHAFSILSKVLDYRWCSVLDIDEFLCYDKKKYRSFNDFLSLCDRRGSDALALSWVVYTPSELRKFQEYGLVRSFLYREPAVDRHVKSIIRPRVFQGSFPHTPKTIFENNIVFQNASGNIHTLNCNSSLSDFSSQPTDKEAWVAHYHLKSTEDFIWKMSRGTGMHKNTIQIDDIIRMDFLPQFLDAFRNSNKIYDDRVCELFGNNLLQEMNKIRERGEISKCEENCIQELHKKYFQISNYIVKSDVGNCKILKDFL